MTKPAHAPRLVLASASPYRRAQLARLNIPFLAVPHACDERATRDASPDAIALSLARDKALSLVETHPDAHILGADQVVDLDAQVLGKPGDRAGAVEQLTALSGRVHRLLSAVALRRPDGGVETGLDVHEMRMRALTPDEIARYVEADQPFDCAGSYKIERLGIALFDAIDGDDFTAIEGLPLLTVVSMLRRAGFPVP